MNMDDFIKHYGVPRRSGRYPWGSGKEAQRSLDILQKNDALKAKGLSEQKRAASLGMSINQLRSQIAYANETRKVIMWDTIHSKAGDGLGSTAISRDLDIPESTVRKYLSMDSPINNVKAKQLSGIEDMLRSQVTDKKYLDIGPGSELQMGVSRNKLNNVVKKLEDDGYYTHVIPVPQLAGQQGRYTNVKVLTKEEDWGKVIKNKDKIQTPETWSNDGGMTFLGLKPIQSIGKDRVKIVYKEEGGSDKDGLIEIKRGAKDLDLGNAKYAQVRIAVDGTHYLKGMAMTVDKTPGDSDVVFYTNKHKGTAFEKVLKPMKDDKDNPFGATIKPNGQRGALNIVNEEGDWKGWKPTFSGQFLSKQPYALVKDRVEATLDKKKKNYDEINSLTNPMLKKKMLNDYADELDGAARSLKLQGFAKTGSHVILPFPNMKANEVYAPNYKNGEKVVLLRHPHGGRFELPELTVNNNGPAKGILKQATDAIGIHPSVASKLSGADFDGDTVLVIPNKNNSIKTMKSLDGLKDFDPVEKYQVDRKTITAKAKQTQMGMVSNLITDMTIKQAPVEDIVRAVRHSMVVIDAEKHNLDYKQSAIDNSIDALKKRYQSHTSKVEVDPEKLIKDPRTKELKGVMAPGKYHRDGASTIISKADKEVRVTDNITGKKAKLKMMDVVSDARLLSSGSAIENAYAGYANSVKKMAISARAQADKIKGNGKNKEAAAKYKEEVDSLNMKLNLALSNAPKERQAQILANKIYSDKLKESELEPDQKKKIKSQALISARQMTGAKKDYIDITDKEWEAIQNNAVSNATMEKIFKNAKEDRLIELALPKTQVSVSTATKGKALTLKGNGYSQSEIAEALGISTSTVNAIINGKDGD